MTTYTSPKIHFCVKKDARKSFQKFVGCICICLLILARTRIKRQKRIERYLSRNRTQFHFHCTIQFTLKISRCLIFLIFLVLQWDCMACSINIDDLGFNSFCFCLGQKLLKLNTGIIKRQSWQEYIV